VYDREIRRGNPLATRLAVDLSGVQWAHSHLGAKQCIIRINPWEMLFGTEGMDDAFTVNEIYRMGRYTSGMEVGGNLSGKYQSPRREKCQRENSHT
jgi:hypothetical protein